MIFIESELNQSVVTRSRNIEISKNFDSSKNVESDYQKKEDFNEHEFNKNIISRTNKDRSFYINKGKKESFIKNCKPHIIPENPINNHNNHQGLSRKKKEKRITKKLDMYSAAETESALTKKCKNKPFCSCFKINNIEDSNKRIKNTEENPTFVGIRNEKYIEPSIERSEISSQIEIYFNDKIEEINSENKLNIENENLNTVSCEIESFKNENTSELKENNLRRYDENMDLWFLSKKFKKSEMAQNTNICSANDFLEDLPVSQIVSSTLDWYETYKDKKISELHKNCARNS